MASSMAWPDVPVLQLSVAQYHSMRDAGILGEEDRVELLEGFLVPKTTKHPPHRLATRLVRAAIEQTVGAAYYVDSQEPINTKDSEPEPDVVVVRGEPRDYSTRHPSAEDIALVVEIADDSLDRDRGVKLRLYARAGIPTYWIVNLRTRALEAYSQASGGSYSQRTDYAASEAVPVVIDGREIARVSVAALLP